MTKPKTNEELLAWGRAENKARKDDLATVKSPQDLRDAQDRAAARRSAAGLSRSQAATWVKEAQVAERGQQ